MGIKQVIFCDNCDKVLHFDGIAVQGNINTVESDAEDGIGSGLVGDNLYEMGGNDVVDTISYFCHNCFVEMVFGKDYQLMKIDKISSLERYAAPPRPKFPY